MKLKNLVKLFSLATFLILGCCCINVSAENWQGITYTKMNSQKNNVVMLIIENEVPEKMEDFKNEMIRQKYYPEFIVTPRLTYAALSKPDSYVIRFLHNTKSPKQGCVYAEKWPIELLQSNPENIKKRLGAVLIDDEINKPQIKCFPYEIVNKNVGLKFNFTEPLMTKQEIQERLKNKPKPAAEGAPLPAPVKDNIPNPYADLPTETSATKAKPAVKEAPVSSANRVRVFMNKNCDVHYQFSDCTLPNGSVVKKLTVFNQITHPKTAENFGEWIRDYKIELSILELQDGLIYHYDIASQNLRIYPGPNCQDFEAKRWVVVAMDLERTKHYIQGNTTVLDRYTTWHGEKREKTYTSYSEKWIGRNLNMLIIDDPRIVPYNNMDEPIFKEWTTLFWGLYGGSNLDKLLLCGKLFK